MSFTQQNPSSQLGKNQAAIQRQHKKKPTRLEKIQKRDELLTHLIAQFQFAPGKYCEGLYVSKQTGAVLYGQGGVWEIDFGFDDTEGIHHGALGETKVVKNLFSLIQRGRRRLRLFRRVLQHLNAHGCY